MNREQNISVAVAMERLKEMMRADKPLRAWSDADVLFLLDVLLMLIGDLMTRTRNLEEFTVGVQQDPGQIIQQFLTLGQCLSGSARQHALILRQSEINSKRRNQMHSKTELQQAWEQDYYNGQSVGHAITQNILSVENSADCEYVELTVDGTTRLAILTPVTVSNGPGRKFSATED